MAVFSSRVVYTFIPECDLIKRIEKGPVEPLNDAIG